MTRKMFEPGAKTSIACALVVWLVTLVGVSARSSHDVAGAEKSAVLRDLPQAAETLRTLNEVARPRRTMNQAAAAAQPVPAQQPAGAAKYVGDNACLGCHEKEQAGYERSPHHWSADVRTPAAKQGCETCHGPGSLHVDDPDHVDVVNDFAKMKPAEINASCTTCHNRGEHALWEGSQHERRDVSCTSCHSQHEPLTDTGLLKAKTETEVCATCHRDKAARMDRSGHMPLREGKMACSSCHNPHGSTSVKLLQKGESVAEMCTSCHADKRGPYLFEHAPTRDGCITCHDPHGSSNDRMLVVRTPMLCQRCHVATRHPSTIYDQSLITTNVRVYARSCVTCHANIHGSNHPSGRFFLR